MRKIKKLAAVCLTAGMTLAMSLVAMAATEVTIHFKNAKNWDAVGVWAYEGTGFTTQVMPQELTPAYNIEDKRAIWPGSKMTAETNYDGWYSIKLTFEEPTKNGAVFIFNNLVADTKVDTTSGGSAADQAYVDASGLVKDSDKKDQTQNYFIVPKNFTAKEYWCDWNGVKGSSGQLSATKPDSYKKKASTKINNLTATGISAKKINLKWDKFKGAQKYYVYYYNTSTKKYVKVGTSTKNSYQVTKINKKALTAGSGYQFIVKAIKSNKVIATSEKAYGAALAVPTVKSVTNSSKGKVTVNINKVSKANGYVIYRSTKAKSGYASIGTTTKTTFVDTTAKKGKTYYYKVAAYKNVSKNKAITASSKTYKQIKVKK